jgi:hypothetical protein
MYFITLICVAPCIFVILVNFVANKCTLFILFLYVTLQVRRHVSILWIIIGASHTRTSSSYYYTIHISLYNSLWLKQVLSLLCI